MSGSDDSEAGGFCVFPVTGLPEVGPGDDLAAMIASRARLREGDVAVVASKVVSKSEGRIRDLRTVQVSDDAVRCGSAAHTDPRVVQVALDEAHEVLRLLPILVSTTREGFVGTFSGVDMSGAPDENSVVLLPEDCDRSAELLSARLRELTGHSVGVIVSDTVHRPWRRGGVNVALGAAGICVLRKNTRGGPSAVADELAGAAELLMDKSAHVPVVIVRGWRSEGPHGRARDVVRPLADELFR
jgi:coenzyme F420-0:L-glutamate ligase / coenzyme F420-1:gamma-L-glutamate ligase